MIKTPVKMAVIVILVLIGICTINIGVSGMCQHNFDIMACYGSYVNPVECPRKKLIINSSLSVINLARCKSGNVLTIFFNKECPLTVRVVRPILTIPSACADRVLPSKYRTNASICLIKQI